VSGAARDCLDATRVWIRRRIRVRSEEGIVETTVVLEKQVRAQQTLRRYVWYSAGAGLIPVLYLDGAAVGALQLKMLADISKIYGVPFEENLGKAAAASVAGFIIPHAAAFGALSKAIPGISVLAAPLAAGFAGVYSWVLGSLFIQHFESGGTFLDLNPERLRGYFRSQFDNEQKLLPVVES
jgi:uncharacterized protein (DUF697 family)